MAPPKGNQFWLARSSHGRKPIFETPEALWNACEEYFKWNVANPLYESQAFAYQGKVKLKRLPKMRAMTIGALCIFLDIDHTTWLEYKKKNDFTRVIMQVEQIIRAQKFEGASADLLNANIIARDLGLADKSELTGKNGAPIEITSYSDEDRVKALMALMAKTKPDIGSTE